MPKLNSSTKSSYYNAKSSYIKGKEYFEDLYKRGKLPDCSRGFIKGNCGCKSYAKNIICGLEWCKDCGQDGSPQHQKRFNRWMPKARKLNKFGVLVVTLPEELRYKYQNKIKLSELRTALKNKLKKLGFEKGLMRWHLFGDCEWCKGKQCYKCKHTGAGNVFKPHLNIVIESGFIKDINTTLIDELKKFITAYWLKIFNKSFTNVINYHYAKRLTDRVHQVKYITRSTFRIYDEEVAQDLKKYRMTTVWGTWKDIKIEKEEALDNNCCLECKTFIRWIGYNKLTNFNTIIHLQNGKFKIVTSDTESQTLKKPTRLRTKATVWKANTHEINFTRFARP